MQHTITSTTINGAYFVHQYDVFSTDDNNGPITFHSTKTVSDKDLWVIAESEELEIYKIFTMDELGRQTIGPFSLL